MRPIDRALSKCKNITINIYTCDKYEKTISYYIESIKLKTKYTTLSEQF